MSTSYLKPLAISSRGRSLVTGFFSRCFVCLVIAVLPLMSESKSSPGRSPAITRENHCHRPVSSPWQVCNLVVDVSSSPWPKASLDTFRNKFIAIFSAYNICQAGLSVLRGSMVTFAEELFLTLAARRSC